MAKGLPTADWQQLSEEAAAQIMEGCAAYRTLKTERPDYQHWVRVSLAWLHLRNAAIKAAGLEDYGPTAIKTKRYQAAIGPLLSDDRAKELAEIEEPTRGHCVWLASNLEKVEKWLNNQATNDKSGGKLALNHPSAIYRRCPYGQKADRAARALEKGEEGSKRRRTRDEADAGHSLLDTVGRASSELSTAMSQPLALRKALDIKADPLGAAESFKAIHGDLPEPVLDQFAEHLHSHPANGGKLVITGIDWTLDDPEAIGLAIAMAAHAAGRDNKFITKALRAAIAALKAPQKPQEAASPMDVPEATEEGEGPSAAPVEAPKRGRRTVALNDPKPRNRKPKGKKGTTTVTTEAVQ